MSADPVSVYVLWFKSEFWRDDTPLPSLRTTQTQRTWESKLPEGNGQADAVGDDEQDAEPRSAEGDSAEEHDKGLPRPRTARATRRLDPNR